MPKLIPVADALSKPFWDAVNQRRLVLQHCTACDRLQYPPQPACQVCNEAANANLSHWVGRASDEKKTEVQVAPEILSKYVGTYVEGPKLWSHTGVPRVVEITVSGGTLFGEMDGRGKQPLIAQSATSFAGLYGLGVEFLKTAPGEPARLLVKHVSGDYPFTRK